MRVRDGEYTVLLVHQHETQSGGVTPCKFARHPSDEFKPARAHLAISEIGSRDARPRRHGLCSDARRTTRVCAAHRRSRGPGDFLIGKGEALRSLPGVRLPAPAPERLSAAHSQFTIHNSHGKSIVRARAAHAHRLEVPARGQWAAPIGQRVELPKGISSHAIARRRAEGADHVAAAAAVVGRADAGGI